MKKLDARNRGLVWTFDAWRITGKWIARTSTLADPFPSHHVDTTLVEMFGGDNPDAYVRRQKIGALAQHLLECELLTGNLVASFLKDEQARPIPTWAWSNPHRTKYAWREGLLPLDIRLPDEWQQWNCRPCALDRKQFGNWIREQLPALIAPPKEIPDLAQIEQEMPVLIKTRLPSDRPWIELSEALTWIAFDISISKDRLGHATDAGELGQSSEVVETELSNALIRLADLAAGGNIGLRGKWTDGDNFEDTLTEAIPQQRFHDFRRYDILRDGLGFGNGFSPSDPLAFLDTSRGQYFSVTVNRAELLKAFPSQSNAALESSDVMLNNSTIELDQPQPDSQVKTVSKVALEAWIKKTTGTASGGRRLGQDVAWKLACEHFEDEHLKVPREIFRSAYQSAAPSHLTARGRPRKNSPK